MITLAIRRLRLKRFISITFATLLLVVSLSAVVTAQEKKTPSYMVGISVTQGYQGAPRVFRTEFDPVVSVSDLARSSKDQFRNALEILVTPEGADNGKDIILAVFDLKGEKLGIVKIQGSNPLRKKVKTQSYKGVDYYAHMTIPLYLEIPKDKLLEGVVIEDTSTGEKIEIKQVYQSGMVVR
jgi:hypothetical protein